MQNHSNQQLSTLLKQNLYSVEPIVQEYDRKSLALAYTPGVGAVCLDINKDVTLADKMTMRGRSVAIVSDGSLLNSEQKNFLPVMDWLVVQFKHYSGYDAFPFVIKRGTDLKKIIRDLSTTYRAVVYLDSQEISEVVDNMLLIKHQAIVSLTSSSLTDLQKTSHILTYFLNHNIKGIPSVQDYKQALASEIVKKILKIQPFVYSADNTDDNSRLFHVQYQGKIHIVNNPSLDFEHLKTVFTEQNLRELVKVPHVYSKTSKLAVIVTDGTRILSLGDIGPTAGLPVMQGKALLFKLLGQVDVVPFCMYPRTTDSVQCDDIANSIGNFMAVNLQDIRSPDCFQIQAQLKRRKLLPVFHDDQHGTAIVTLAALINAVKVAGKDMKNCKIVINGAGAAGITITKLIHSYGADNIITVDTKGAIYKGRKEGMNETKKEIAEFVNKNHQIGGLQKMLDKADVFIGVSVAGALKGEWIKHMNQKPIIFALANPDPEIFQQQAKDNGAFIYGSGRSDFQNQINNSLVFPGIFRSIKEHNLKEITLQMKLQASVALSKCLQRQATQDYVIPASLDKHLSVVISKQIGGDF